MAFFSGSDRCQMRNQPITRPCWTGFPIHLRDACRRSSRGGAARGKLLALCARGVGASIVALFSISWESFADDTVNPAPAPVVQSESTNSEALLQAVLLVQAQLQSNQWAIEQNERQITAAAVQNAEALSNGLRRIESNFSAQAEDFSTRSARDLEAMQSSNRSMLTVAGIIGAIAFLGMLVSGYFQWRTGKVWGEISMLLPTTHEALRGPPARLGIGGNPLVTSSSIEDANMRLLGAIEQLEKRIQRLEQSSGPALRIHAPGTSSAEHGGPAAASMGGTAIHSEPSATGPGAQIAALLGQGQSRLKDNEPEAALKCFDQALSLSPNNPEALVKKGVTLEKLKRLSEAFECYDQAIAANATMTSAYLRKGSLYNRVERFKEALECYERALQAQEAGGD